MVFVVILDLDRVLWITSGRVGTVVWGCGVVRGCRFGELFCLLFILLDRFGGRVGGSRGVLLSNNFYSPITTHNLIPFFNRQLPFYGFPQLQSFTPLRSRVDSPIAFLSYSLSYQLLSFFLFRFVFFVTVLYSIMLFSLVLHYT